MYTVHDGHHFQHRSEDVPVILSLLHPLRPTTLVELGTDEGGFAAVLADWSRAWGGRVWTFDIQRKWKPDLLDGRPDLTYVEADVLVAGGCPEVLKLLGTPVPWGHAQMEALRTEWYPEPMSRFWVRRERA